MKIVLIRHGLTEGNLEKRYIGRASDEPLCREGKKSLENAVARGKYPLADCVFSSPLLRCVQTAEIIYGNKKPVLIPELCEMDFGLFEGKNFLELKEDSRYQEWIESKGTLGFPGGEDREQFVARTMAGYHKILGMLEEKFCGKDSSKTVTIICHGGSIMAILSSLGFGEYFDFQVKNGEGFCFEVGGKNCSII